MISLEEAQAYVLSHCQPLIASEVPLAHALGCVTSVAIFADGNVPPFANSAMDGYAVRAVDVAGAPVTLEVVGDLPAGTAPTVEVGEGQAVRIMTGAAMPTGADAVVMVERTKPSGSGQVVIEEAVEAGNCVRNAGDDLPQGQIAIPAATEIGPGHLGVLASLGMDEVPVYPKPRVGVLSTGDELIEPPAPLAPGQIRDANRHTLLALVRSAGLEATDLGIVRDDKDAVVEAIQSAAAAHDLVLTSGGVSVGDHDHVDAALEQLGAGTARNMEVAIKPAKPLGFAVVNGTPVFALPGNPVSAMVSYELFAFPALRKILGHTHVHRRKVLAVAEEDLPRRRDGKLHLLRAQAVYGEDGRFHVKLSGGQASHLLRAMAEANALALVPDGEGIPAGSGVEVLLLSYR